MLDGICPKCSKPAMTLRYVDGIFVCAHCVGRHSDLGCRTFEYGHENPLDPKGSTAHVRDIKARRYDFKEKRTFNYEPPKTYFFPRG